MAIPEYQRQVREGAQTVGRLEGGAQARVYDAAIQGSGANTNIARGLSDLAAGVSALAETRERSDLAERMSQFSQELQEYQYNVDTGSLYTQKKDADGVATRTQEAINGMYDKYLKGLSKNNADLLRRTMSNQTLGAIQRNNQHEMKEMTDYRVETMNTIIQQAGILMSNNLSDGANTRAAIDLLIGGSADLWGGTGISSEQMAGKIKDAQKQAFAHAINIGIQQSPAIVMDFFKNNQDLFTEAERTAIERTIDEGTLDYKTEQFAKDRIAKYGFKTDLDGATQWVKENVRPDQQKAYLNEYSSQVRMEQAIETQEVTKLQRESVALIYGENSTYSNAKTQIKAKARQLEAMGYADIGADLLRSLDQRFKRGDYAPQTVGRSASKSEQLGVMYGLVNLITANNFSSEEELWLHLMKTGASDESFRQLRTAWGLHQSRANKNAKRYISDGNSIGGTPEQLFERLMTNVKVTDGETRWELGQEFGRYIDNINAARKQPMSERQYRNEMANFLTKQTTVKTEPYGGILGFFTQNQINISNVEKERLLRANPGLLYSPGLQSLMYVSGDEQMVYNYDMADPNMILDSNKQQIGSSKKPAGTAQEQARSASIFGSK